MGGEIEMRANRVSASMRQVSPHIRNLAALDEVMAVERSATLPL
jgi:hypothetical protein